MPAAAPNDLDVQNEPMYWFAVLSMARDRDDFEQALRAQRELERLGVRVRYRRPCRREACDGQ